eukprot:jgi/Botrbrau1/19813/Bobra.0124s0056.1
MVRGPTVEYSFDTMERKNSRAIQLPQQHKLFVGGLSWNTTDADLMAYFSQYGDVHDAYIAVNQLTSQPRGFGFVVFDNSYVAKNVRGLTHIIGGRKVEVKEAIPKEDMGAVRTAPTEQRKLFIGGLAPATQMHDLIAYFSQYGIVEDAVVMQDHNTKRPRGFGFVTYSTAAAAFKAYEAGQKVFIKDKVVEVKFAVPRDDVQPNGVRVNEVSPRPVRGTQALYHHHQNPYQFTQELLPDHLNAIYSSIFQGAAHIVEPTRPRGGPGVLPLRPDADQYLFPQLQDVASLQGAAAGGYQALALDSITGPREPGDSYGFSERFSRIFTSQPPSWPFSSS